MSRVFDKVDDVISMGASDIADNIGPMTVMAWIKPRSGGENSAAGGVILTKRTTAQGWIFRVIGTTTTTPALLIVTSATLQFIAGSAGQSINVWHHYAATWNGVVGAPGGAGEMHMYSDFVLDDASAQTGTGTRDDSALNLLARNSSAGDRTFDGPIAHVQLFNVVLTLDEIKQAGLVPGSVRRGLIGYWPFGGTSPEPDYSRFGNHGAITGATVSSDNPPINGIFKIPKPQLSYTL